MRKYLLIIFLFGVTAQLNAQYAKNAELENYKHTITYPDHKVVLHAQPLSATLKYTDPEKKYYWYSNNQLKITQGGFSGKLLHGLYTDFYLNNNLKEQGDFEMGLKKGIWKNWSENGVLATQIKYKNGIANGTFYRYNADGLLVETGKYKNGVELQQSSKKSWLKRMFSKKTPVK